LVWVALVLAVAGGAWWLYRGSRAGVATAPADRGAPRRGARRESERRAPVWLSAATREEDPAAGAGTIEGRVVSSVSGDGIGGASLSFLHGGVAIAVSADGVGTFKFAPGEPVRYELHEVAARGYLPFVPEVGHSPVVLVARPGVRIGDVTLHLVPAVGYEGKVLDSNGNPVGGAEVRRLGGGPGERRWESDREGKFAFHAEDGALLEGRKVGHGAGRAEVDFAVQVSHQLTIRLGPAGADGGAGAALGSIAGRVVDAQGRPVEGALVQARADDRRALPGRERHPSGSATSDADGAFTIEDLDEVDHEVTARGPGRASASGVRPGARGLELRLALGGAIEGVVRDAASGRPVAGFVVELLERRGALERASVATATFFDPDGRYRLDGIASGDYLVTAVAAGRAPSPEARATVAAGEATRVDLALAAGARLRGRVIEAEGGAPIAGARVTLEGAGGDEGVAPLATSARTGADGAFAIAGLGPGLRSILVAAAGHHGRIVSGLHIDTDDPEPLTVALDRTAPGEEPRIELAGIGAVLSARGDALVIGQVLPGGGAAEAGLLPGDAIVAVDGTAVTDYGFQESLQHIRGPEGSVVLLGVRRGGDGGAMSDIAVTRRRIRT
jgi:hypothetical protein